MFRVILILGLLLALFLLLRNYARLDQPARKRFWVWFGFGLIFAGVLFLTVTGRLHFIAAIATAALPFARRMLPLLRYVPLLRRLYKERQQSAESTSHSAPISASANLSIEEAYEVLGLDRGASREDIIEAHRRLMQKFHPDRGGNDYLAARINQAKDLLLKESA